VFLCFIQNREKYYNCNVTKKDGSKKLFFEKWEAIHPRRKGKLHRERSPPTTARRSRQPSRKKVIRQDTTDPKQKAVTDYKEQVDRPPPTPFTGKLKSRRTNTTTTDIIRSPISEQQPQEIAHVTYLTLI